MSAKPLVPVAQLMVAWLTVFLVGTELFIFSPLLPMLATDYHISATSAGISVTIFSFTYMISAPLFGYLSDQIGVTNAFVVSGAICLAAAAISAFSLKRRGAANFTVLRQAHGQ